MSRFEQVNGEVLEIRHLVRVGGSKGLTIPAYLLRNLGVYGEDTVFVGIKEEEGSLRIRFFSETALVEATSHDGE